ncbi:MAG: alpha/beta hydrolase [Methylophilaceae bacterium]
MKFLKHWLFPDFSFFVVPQDLASNADKIEPATLKFLKTLAKSDDPAIETLSPAEARKVLIQAQASVNVDVSGVDISSKDINVGGETISLDIVRPQGVSEALPAVVFFHGGGWVLGDFPTHKRLVRDLAIETHAAVIFVNYTPSPEERYPNAINQAYKATKWVAEHGNEINVDGKRLAVAGNSAGGNMATVVSLKAKELGGPDIRYQVLFWPVTDADFETESYQQFEEGYFLTKKMMQWFWDNYSPNKEKRKDIYSSPLQASLAQLKGLPPTLVQTAEFDVLRDEGESYARKLSEAGVKVTATRYLGTIHDFGLLNPLAGTPAAISGILQAACELKKVLHDNE